MNTERVYIVIILVIAIVVLSNVVMFAVVRGMRGVNFHWFSRSKDAIHRPFRYEDESLEELRRRVQGLSEEQDSK